MSGGTQEFLAASALSDLLEFYEVLKQSSQNLTQAAEGSQEVLQEARQATLLALQTANIKGNYATEAELSGRAAGSYLVGPNLVDWNGAAVTRRLTVFADVQGTLFEDVPEMLASTVTRPLQLAGGPQGGVFQLLPANDPRPDDGIKIIKRPDGLRYLRAGIQKNIYQLDLSLNPEVDLIRLLTRLNGGADRATILLGKLALTIAQPLFVDCSRVALIGDNAQINAAHNGTILTVGAMLGPGEAGYVSAWRQAAAAHLAGIEFVGPGKSVAGSKAVLYHTDNGAMARASSHLKAMNLNVMNVEQGYVIGDHAYALNHDHCDAWNCGTAIVNPAGTVDTGERITFAHGTLYNSLLAVDNQQPNGLLALLDMSLDYNIRQINIAGGGKVLAVDPHMESGTYTDPPINVQGAGAAYTQEGGCVVCTLTGPHPFLNFVQHGEGTDTTFRDVHMGNLLNGANRFSEGRGRIQVINPLIQEFSPFPSIIYAGNGPLVNPEAAQPIIQDDWRITEDGQPITTVTTTGASTSVRISPNGGRTGGPAHQVSKSTAAGAPSAAELRIPLERGRSLLGFEFWAQALGGGSSTVQLQWLKTRATGEVLAYIPFQSFTLTGNAGYQKFSGLGRPPRFADTLQVWVRNGALDGTTAGAGQGGTYLDKLYFNQF